MALETIAVSLRAWHPEGNRIRAADFVDRLLFGAGDAVKKAESPGVSRIELLSLAVKDFEAAGEPSEAFAAALRLAFTRAAEWLERQSPVVFQELQNAGMVTDIFIAAWIDVDQIDLDLPPDFLRVCGKHGLTVSLITND